jgi:hypothetical protein
MAVGLIALPSHSRSMQDPQATPPAPPEAGVREMPEAELAPGMPDVEREFNIVTSLSDDMGSWLGVETREVTAENVKEFKLPGERGVVIGKVLDDSPAAKAGLKDNDVVTEINGQRVEGACAVPPDDSRNSRGPQRATDRVAQRPRANYQHHARKNAGRPQDSHLEGRAASFQLSHTGDAGSCAYARNSLHRMGRRRSAHGQAATGH